MSLLCKLVPERCIACGLCQIEAPDIFDYDEEGIVLFAQEPEAHQQFVMPEEETYVKKAYQKCPVRAILLENININETLKTYTKFSKLENKPGSVSLVP